MDMAIHVRFCYVLLRQYYVRDIIFIEKQGEASMQ